MLRLRAFLPRVALGALVRRSTGDHATRRHPHGGDDEYHNTPVKLRGGTLQQLKDTIESRKIVKALVVSLGNLLTHIRKQLKKRDAATEKPATPTKAVVVWPDHQWQTWEGYLAHGS